MPNPIAMAGPRPAPAPSSSSTAPPAGKSGGGADALFDLLFALQMGGGAGLFAEPGPAPDAAATDAALNKDDPERDGVLPDALLLPTAEPVPLALPAAPAVEPSPPRGEREDRAREPGEISLSSVDSSANASHRAAKDGVLQSQADALTPRALETSGPRDDAVPLLHSPHRPEPQPVALVPRDIEPAVGSAGFQDAFVRQVGMLVDQKNLTAELHVNPPDMGPIQVQIRMNQDQVDIGFFSTASDTRDAIETAIPKLRELLAEQGLQLGGATVGGDWQGPRDDTSAPFRQVPWAEPGAASVPGTGAPLPAAPAMATVRVPRLIDTFV